MRFLKQDLTRKIASSFLLLSLVSVAVVGVVTFLRARDALKEAAFERLGVAATLKEEEIERWFEEQQRDFLLTIQFPDVKAKLKTVLSNEVSEAKYKAAYQVLSRYLLEIQKVKPNLQEISILDRSNKIIISTDKNRENRYESLANISNVDEVRQGNKFAPIFYVSPDTGEPAVTLARTIRNGAKIRQGIAIANLNLGRIDEIVRESTGLGTTGETYLVGSLGRSKNTFIAKAEIKKHESSQKLSSKGIDEAMSGVSDFGEYRNYDKVPVLGVYRWLNEQDLALIVEITQEEAFAPAKELANVIVLISLISAGVLLVGVYWLSQQLTISRRQLEIKAQEAESANYAKSEFLANMSHELRTPLNAILGFAQFMERDKTLSSEQRESLATINHSGEHLLSLINDVLDMSKIEAGRVILNLESCNLHLLLHTLQEMFKLRTNSKGLNLKFNLDANLPQYIITDENKLRQVLINLLGNAIKFTETGEVSLKVRTHKTEFPNKINIKNNNQNSTSNFLHFQVKDTGKGISSEEIHQIFDPFVQTNSGVKSRNGTGLGLAISRQFVKLMGGDIHVESILEEGSTFSFDINYTLPEKPVEESLSRRRVSRIAPSQPNYRILVVDDRKPNRDLLAKLLKVVGFQTRTATNGLEAIETWQEWHPHLIWMDMRMTIMDGYEATRRIKAMCRETNIVNPTENTIIIALTASAFEEQNPDIFAAGCDDFVFKPFQEQIIFDKIHKYLGVEYVYEEEDTNSSDLDRDKTINSINSINYNIQLTPQDLIVMPPKWIADLNKAAVQVDADLILQIIEYIPKSHQTLAKKLQKLVSDYDFDTIIEVSKSCRS
ncbi:MAG: ATP-binding protein [Cyanobacteria bacterium P01_A01_bin.84]